MPLLKIQNVFQIIELNHGGFKIFKKIDLNDANN
jgi:hypothetical protein